MLRRQLTGAKDVIGRIQAAYELAETGRRGNIQAIVAAYREEPFWGVRCEFAKALSKADTGIAAAGLAELVDWEQDPMVLAILFEAAGHYRDLRIRDALGARLEGELPYRARAAAYKSMGSQREAAQWEPLVKAAQQDSYNGLVQSGAFLGLAATRREEAIPLLLEYVTYGACSNRARPAAVSALADIGQGQEKETLERILETLIDLLRDPWDWVRFAAARGLKTLRAKQAIPALTAFARALAHQERVEVERMVAALRQEDKLDGSALKKQVEALDEKVRKLEEQLQKLAAQVEPTETEE